MANLSPSSNDGTGVGPARGLTTSAPRRGWKVFGTIVLVKVFMIIVVVFLLRELQIELGTATALLVLLHVAVAALVAYKLRYKLRGMTLHRRRKQHEERTVLVPREVNSSPQKFRAVGDEKGSDAD